VSVPLWAAFALAIKLDDGGPVVYRQRRWGRDKCPILVLKFRTMTEDAERRFENRQAEENDPRITRVGRFLRATSLDEMPRSSASGGAMSRVGPRALRINELQINETNGHVPDEQIPGFDLRCRVRPGLTGLAQIYASRDVPRSNKFRYDALYPKVRPLAGHEIDLPLGADHAEGEMGDPARLGREEEGPAVATWGQKQVRRSTRRGSGERRTGYPRSRGTK